MLIGIKETIELIRSGRLLHIAADERLLNQLPKGNWVGGTTPYFIAETGGILSEEKLFVQPLDIAREFRIALYDSDTIHSIGADAYDNGFTILVLPFGSKVLETFAEDAPDIEDIFLKSIAGWVSGFNLEKGGEAKAFNGQDGVARADKAVALHVCLPENKIASIGIVNIFSADNKSPVIEFSAKAFEATECLIDGREVNFASYIEENRIDTQLPLVANYSGSMVNISIKQVEGSTVKFYAPVFPSTQYRFARLVGDYAAAFEKDIRSNRKAEPVFSCNCILNYLYGGLEGKSTAPFMGPVTFGEVAYQLVNQTLVYITVQ